MTNAQTEARASLWVPAKPEHAKIGWTYDFEQTERISRAAYDSTGYDATMEVVEFVMAEADRRLATALTAKEAELAVLRAELNDCASEIHELRAQLAEARKALEPFAWIGQWLFARDLPDETPVVMVEGAGKPFALTRGMFKAAHTTARRALEAQGGE